MISIAPTAYIAWCAVHGIRATLRGVRYLSQSTKTWANLSQRNRIGAAVNREQAAAGAGVAHHVAKFHLDRLVDDGLLTAEYRRPAGRGGPGAGRPAKLYRRSDVDLEVSLPERRYDLAGRLLVRAVAEA